MCADIVPAPIGKSIQRHLSVVPAAGGGIAIGRADAVDVDGSCNTQFRRFLREGGKQMQVIRKRGAPLGNWNALKSGKYSPRRRAERRARRVAEFEGKCRRQTTGH